MFTYLKKTALIAVFFILYKPESLHIFAMTAISAVITNICKHGVKREIYLLSQSEENTPIYQNTKTGSSSLSYGLST